MSLFGPAMMGACNAVFCYRSSETGEVWCPRFRQWRETCPKDDAEREAERLNEEWMGEEPESENED